MMILDAITSIETSATRRTMDAQNEPSLLAVGQPFSQSFAILLMFRLPVRGLAFSAAILGQATS